MKLFFVKKKYSIFGMKIQSLKNSAEYFWRDNFKESWTLKVLRK